GGVTRNEKVQVNGKETWIPRMYDCFRPKVLATRRTFGDEAFESRCITIEMREKFPPETYPVQLPASAKTEAAVLCTKSETWASQIRGKIAPWSWTPMIGRTEGRFKEIFYPLASLFGQEIENVMKSHKGRIVENLKDSEEADIIIAIDALYE